MGDVDLKELVRTNDLVMISLIESLFKEEGIEFLLLDQHMSVLEGSIGILQRRIMVTDDKEHVARRLLKDAGLEKQLEINESDG